MSKEEPKATAMNLYLISQTANNSYDTYDSAVVVAATEEDARKTHPYASHHNPEWWSDPPYHLTSCDGKDARGGTWTRLTEVTAKLVGVAAPGMPAGVVCASFNAG